MGSTKVVRWMMKTINSRSHCHKQKFKNFSTILTVCLFLIMKCMTEVTQKSPDSAAEQNLVPRVLLKDSMANIRLTSTLWLSRIKSDSFLCQFKDYQKQLLISRGNIKCNKQTTKVAFFKNILFNQIRLQSAFQMDFNSTFDQSQISLLMEELDEDAQMITQIKKMAFHYLLVKTKKTGNLKKDSLQHLKLQNRLRLMIAQALLLAFEEYFEELQKQEGDKLFLEYPEFEKAQAEVQDISFNKQEEEKVKYEIEKGDTKVQDEVMREQGANLVFNKLQEKKDNKEFHFDF